MATTILVHLFLILSSSSIFKFTLAAGSATYSADSVHAEFEVKCVDTALVVYFNKTALESRTINGYSNRPYSIRFAGTDSEECMAAGGNSSNINSNYTVITATSMSSDTVYIATNFTQNMCGINTISDESSIIYNTTVIVTYGENPNPLIKREEYDHYNVKCVRDRKVNASLGNAPANVLFRETQQINKSVSLDYNFKFRHSYYNNRTFQGFYKMGDIIKFSLTMESQNNVKGVIQECRATSDANSANAYKLIFDRCNTEPGTKLISTQNKETIFTSEAFTYITGENSIYVECTVHVCLASDNTRSCSLCLGGPGKRKRREVTVNDDQATDQTTIIKSPVFYIIAEDAQQSATSDNDNESNFFTGTTGLIVIVLLAVLVLVNIIVFAKKFFFKKPPATQSNDGHQNPAFDKI